MTFVTDDTTLSEAVRRYDPAAVFALFSGGHDSLCATAIAARHPRFTAAVHINTGIGIEETREFVRETCQREGWPLLEYRPPRSYEQIVLADGWTGGGKHLGFPGPGMHPATYVLLKERCLDALVRDYKTRRADRIVLVSGARSEESKRRMRAQVKPVERDGATVWVAPIHDWTKPDCNRFIEARGMRRSVVVDLLHMSGECLCGSFGKAARERPEIARWFPDTEAHIAALERRVAEAGIWNACRWATRPLEPIFENQLSFDGRTVKARMCLSCDGVEGDPVWGTQRGRTVERSRSD